MTEEASSAAIVLHNAYVVTMDGALVVLRNGADAVVGERIAAVGPSADVLADFPGAAQTLDLAGRILLPGWCLRARLLPNLLRPILVILLLDSFLDWQGS